MVKRKPQLTTKHGKNNFNRRAPYKSQRSRILIVCDDEKHSKRYFMDFINDLRLTATVKVVSSNYGSQPTQVYKSAQRELEKDIEINGNDNSYDFIYCVIDKDQHSDFDDALQKIKNKGKPFIAITSVPCFEFWILLHFDCTSSPFLSYKELEKSIKKYWREYRKEDSRDLYSKLKSKTMKAVTHSKQVLKYIDGENANPSTLIHEVIEHFYKECGMLK